MTVPHQVINQQLKAVAHDKLGTNCAPSSSRRRGGTSRGKAKREHVADVGWVGGGDLRSCPGAGRIILAVLARRGWQASAGAGEIITAFAACPGVAPVTRRKRGKNLGVVPSVRYCLQ